jgi:hypothetical protein
MSDFAFLRFARFVLDLSILPRSPAQKLKEIQALVEIHNFLAVLLGCTANMFNNDKDLIWKYTM